MAAPLGADLSYRGLPYKNPSIRARKALFFDHFREQGWLLSTINDYRNGKIGREGA